MGRRFGQDLRRGQVVIRGPFGPLFYPYNALCEPSQSGAFADCLQPQKNTFLDASAVYFIGAKLDPLWDPSQNGCFADFPQAHQK